jgi:hypothetical protein
VTLADPGPGDSLSVRPTFLLRDFYDTPADTSVAAGVAMPGGEADGERFIATRATLIGRDTVAIDFNGPVDPATAEVLANYTLSPGGSFVSARVAPGMPDRVLLVLGHDYPVGPLGKIYAVTIMNVRSAAARLINDGAGSVVGFVVTAGNLDAVFVYPQPFSHARDASITFAGLTRSAQVRIYTQSGRIIKELEAREGNGGAEWDGRDDRGEPVPPGIYLYMVSGATPDGTSYESEPRKIAVVP